MGQIQRATITLNMNTKHKNALSSTMRFCALLKIMSLLLFPSETAKGVLPKVTHNQE